MTARTDLHPPVIIDGQRGWLSLTDPGDTTLALGAERNGQQLAVLLEPAAIDDLIAALQDMRGVIGDRWDAAAEVAVQ